MPSTRWGLKVGEHSWFDYFPLWLLSPCAMAFGGFVLQFELRVSYSRVVAFPNSWFCMHMFVSVCLCVPLCAYRKLKSMALDSFCEYKMWHGLLLLSYTRVHIYTCTPVPLANEWFCALVLLLFFHCLCVFFFAISFSILYETKQSRRQNSNDIIIFVCRTKINDK